MLLIFIGGVFPSLPIYEGAFVKEGLNLVVGISGFIGKDLYYEEDPWGGYSARGTYFKTGLKADIKLGYNLGTWVSRLLHLSPPIDVELYLALSGRIGLYDGKGKECYYDCYDLSYSMEAHREGAGGMGLRLMFHTKTVRIGADLWELGLFSEPYFRDVVDGYFHSRILIGFGYPEILSVGFGGGASGYAGDPEYTFYSISLSFNRRRYFISTTLYGPLRYAYQVKVPKRLDISLGLVLPL